ncbi:immunoglobulin-binding protein 1b [Plodia interpunctella]|uniref:immunoglobulin-binding protein 1b n=1 Tax=Plodia interpunctella TaxID=58824 RepID=UPI0023686A1C|nr:immunoglobulin-binding protein 1b [Plodia interpunctella]
MSQSRVGQSHDEENPKHIFEEAMKLFDNIENGKEATNSDPVQMSIKAAISKFEKATNMVSMLGLFSKNESLEELSTDTLQYLLLPALLGTLSLKLCGQPRKEVIDVAEIYFRDFLQRCRDYGLTSIEVPQPSSSTEGTVSRAHTEQGKIEMMVMTREAKIKRYRQQKELQEKLSTLSKAVNMYSVDDETKREYYTTLLHSYVNEALDELASIEQERPILEYMEKNSGESRAPKEKPTTRGLRAVVLARDAALRAVLGAGYPALPALTVQEFYDQRVRDGVFPGNCDNIPHTTLQSADLDHDEAEQMHKETLEETDDPEELARKRNMDEYKDDHRRGWGNRYNRS